MEFYQLHESLIRHVVDIRELTRKEQFVPLTCFKQRNIPRNYLAAIGVHQNIINEGCQTALEIITICPHWAFLRVSGMHSEKKQSFYNKYIVAS